jgi:manganese/zinc/iron transport system permease protein
MYDFFVNYGWVLLMGILVSASCGLAGIFLVYQRLSLFGDALSHSILPGVVGAYWLLGKRSEWGSFLGAWVVAGGVSYLIQAIARTSRLKSDAVLAVLFGFFFALGILGVTVLAKGVDLDLDCVLFGEIAFVGFEPGVMIFGILWPLPIVYSFGLLILEGVLLILFCRGLWIFTFDKDVARVIGVPVAIFRYGFLFVVLMLLMNTFRNVGALLVGGMFIFPVVTARLWAEQLVTLMVSILFLCLFYAIAGVGLAIYYHLSIAAMMVCVAFSVFMFSFLWRVIFRKAFKEG